MDDELLCLAFCVITETNRESEMAYVAGCILNRVRNRYWFKHWATQAEGHEIRGCVLSDWQFSAFKSKKQPSAEREALENSDPEVAVAAFNAKHGRVQLFETAVRVCGEVLAQEELQNPWLNGQVDHPRAAFVHHYFSPVSFGPSVPAWFEAKKEVLVPDVETHRFRWFHDVP